MAKIVFWSYDSAMTGNTYTTIAVGTLMAITRKVSCLLMQGNFNSKKIESSFTPYSSLMESGAFENSSIGVSALIRLVASNKLTTDAIQNYAKPVLKERLDVLYGMAAKDKEGYMDVANKLPYIIRKAAEVYDVVMIDLPKTLNQKYIKDTLADADIVVCTINQDVIKLDEFFKKLDSIEELKNKQKILVMADYESKSKYNVSNIKIKYKIKDPLFVLPHNYLYSDACNSGNVVDFFYRNLNADIKDYNGYFIKQTHEIVERIFEIAKFKDN